MQTPKIQIVEEPDELAPHLAAWDALALARERPFCAPAWMLAWWRAHRDGHRRLHVILAHEDERLLGVAPFFAQLTLGLVEMRLLGAGFSHRIGILSREGCEQRVSGAFAAALARGRPASVVFEGVDGEDPWPQLIASRWPGRLRPALRTDSEMQAPVIRLDGSYEQWMERRDRRYRKEARRLARRLSEQGVSERFAADEQAIDTLLRLHHARWSRRGGSNVDEKAREVLVGAAAELRSTERLFVALLDGDASPVAAELVVRAGRCAVFWGGGFDPDWAPYGPGTQTMLFALRNLAQAGVQTADLGGGDHSYKDRMADETTTLAWRTVFPRGWRYLPIRLLLAPKHARLALRKAARRLPDDWQRRLTRGVRALRARR